MEYRFLLKKEIASFVTGLLKEFKVYGPVKKDGFPMYGEITSPKELNLLHTPTHLSPKQYLFPQRETLLKFKNGDNPSVEPVVEAQDQVLFGVHSCDIHAFRLLGRVFAHGTPDVNYLKKREKTIIDQKGIVKKLKLEDLSNPRVFGRLAIFCLIFFPNLFVAQFSKINELI